MEMIGCRISRLMTGKKGLNMHRKGDRMNVYLKAAIAVLAIIVLAVLGKEKLREFFGTLFGGGRTPDRGKEEGAAGSAEKITIGGPRGSDDLSMAKKQYSDIIYRLDHPQVGTKSFEARLEKCRRMWKEIRQSAGAEDRANIILAGYYAEDRLKSKLADFCEYVEEELEEEQSSESIVLCGFNSCLNFAWLDYKNMKERLKKMPLESGSSPNGADRWDFLQDMSYRGGAFGELYSALSLGKRKFEANEPIGVSDKELLAMLTKVRGYMDDTSSDYFSWDRVMNDYNRMKEKRETAIEKARDLEERLEQVMIEAVIMKMKDKECPVDQLKNLYRGMDKKIKENLPDIKE